MPTKKKLTLSIDEQVIERAHTYSRDHGTSISRLVSRYLQRLGSPSESHLSPFVLRLKGVLPPDVSVEQYRQHVEKKHG